MIKNLIHVCSLTILLMSAQSLRAQWVKTNGTFNGSVNCIAFEGNNIYAGTSYYGLYVSGNNGSNWSKVDSVFFQSTDILSMAFSGPYGFVGTYNGVYSSSDSGKTWIHDSGFNGGDVYALAFSGNVIFAGTYGGAYVSVDNGTTWAAARTGMQSYPDVLSFAVNGTTIYAGTNDSVYVHTPGTGWTNISNGLPNTSFYSLVVSGSNIFAATYSYGVYLSSDTGKSWKAVNNGLQSYYSIRYLAASGANIFAGTQGYGIYFSNNNGNSWTAVNTGLTDTYITSLAINGNTVYAGTENDGVWKRPLSEMVGIAENSNPLTEFHIYPNPATNQLTIQSSVKDEHATISIMNVLGQDVSTPLNVRRSLSVSSERSRTEVEVDVSMLPSGIYFIVLDSEKERRVERFVKE